MSSDTENLHLIKPASTDTADIGIINGNMDIIDDALVNIPTSSVVGLGDYYYQDNTTGTTVPTATVTAIATVSVPPGWYLIRLAANFPANANGFRAIGIGKGSTSVTWRHNCVQVAPMSGSRTYITTTHISHCTANSTTIYGVAEHTAGSDLAVTGIIEAIRIK